MSLFHDAAEDYAFCFGRISGMESKMFTDQAIVGLAQAGSLAEVLSNLEGSEFQREIKEADFESISSIEETLNVHFFRIYDDLTSTIVTQDKEELDSLLAGERDHFNLKLLLRGFQKGIGFEDLRDSFRFAGIVNFEFLESLASSTDLDELLKGIESKTQLFGKRLGEVELDQSQTENEASLDLAMDYALAESWVNKEFKNPALREYVNLRIDLINLLNMLRCIVWGVDPKKYVISGGLIIRTQRLLNSSPLELSVLKDEIKSSVLEPLLDGVETDDPETIDFAALEFKAEKIRTRFISEKSMVDPLTLYSLLQFFSKKEAEIKNIRTIVYAKYYDLPVEEITKAMS
ncbi:MAG: V-type ATPase subunit [Candidatus Altiarchaeota archaeon]